MSNAPRPARWNSRSRSCAGQDRVFGQRKSTSPSLAGQRGAAGRAVGRELERPLGAGRAGRRPGRRPRGSRRRPCAAPPCRRSARPCGPPRPRCAAWPGPTVEPADLDRLHDRERRHPAGPADVDLDVQQLGGDLLRRVLVGDRPARRPAGRAELPLQVASRSTLTTTPSISWSGRAGARRSSRCTRAPASRSSTTLYSVADRQPPPPAARTSPTGCPARPAPPRPVRPGAGMPPPASRAGHASPCTTRRSGRLAVTRGSFCRSEPAAVLRGLANGGLPASTSRSFSSCERRDREVDLAADLAAVSGQPDARQPVRAPRRWSGRSA